jgi:hypothetical protein
VHASGFGEVGDGRSFSFHIERQSPQADDVVAVAHRTLTEIDLNDERSLTAAVRDALADAQPVPRPNR